MKILITGANGYVGKAIHSKIKHLYEVDLVTREICNLLDSSDVDKFFEGKKYDVIIHSAVVGGSRMKEDDSDILINNLSMFFNLYNNREHFTKLITFGSGAEDITSGLNFYGRSKKLISEYIGNIDNFYSLKIYGVFDENELNTRFIKTCIHKFLEGGDLIIDNDRYMDFIYMTDFLKIVVHYIENNPLDKGVDCCYTEKYKLSDIAKMILPEPRINILHSSTSNYIGIPPKLDYMFLGLGQGIEETRKILCSKL